MHIAVIGAGRVGTALGNGWKRAGHTVTYVGRDQTPADDVIALAIPWAAVESVLRKAGPLDGRVLLDCTNGAPPGARSGGEQVAAWAPKARVVKIFNMTGFENMSDPRYGTEAATMFYAGDDAAAKQTAARLANDLGFDPVDAGPLANARFLETLAAFWGALAYGQHMGRGIAFRLLRR
jgi:predicted dinucleotide-binding enzyme